MNPPAGMETLPVTLDYILELIRDLINKSRTAGSRYRWNEADQVACCEEQLVAEIQKLVKKLYEGLTIRLQSAEGLIKTATIEARRLINSQWKPSPDPFSDNLLQLLGRAQAAVSEPMRKQEVQAVQACSRINEPDALNERLKDPATVSSSRDF